MTQLTIPLSEREIGQQILDTLAEKPGRREYLDALDEAMIELACSRPSRQVRPDEARKVFESWNPPPPEELSRNFLGALWNRRHWQTDGTTYISETDGSHGNRLLIWTYVGE